MRLPLALGFREEAGDFLLREMTPAAAREVGNANVADADTAELFDGAADGREHPPDLAVAALEDGELDLRAARSLDFPGGLLHADILGGKRLAVREFDARGQLRDTRGIGHAAHHGAVGLPDMVLRMADLVEEIAVVGEEDEALRLDIEPAHGPQERLLLQVDQIDHGARRMRIADSARDASRLVQSDIVVPVRGFDEAVVEYDSVDRDIDFRTQFRHDLPVDGHPPLRNQLFTTPAGGDAGCRQDLLQPFLHKFDHLVQ